MAINVQNEVDEMSKADIIFALVLSLNQGNSGYSDNRVATALAQYKQLIDKGLIPEDKI